MDYALQEWYWLKIKAIVFAVLDIVTLRKETVQDIILEGNQKWGMKFEPWKIDWTLNRKQEGRDTFTYTSGSDFTRSLLKHGKES